MTVTRKLSESLNAELKTAGFKKKGATWYLGNNDVIAVLNLQKSSYDATHFFNLGFWIRVLEDVENPRHEQCHVRSRAEELWPNEEPMVTELLSFDTSADCNEERLAEIRKLVRERITPFLVRGSDMTGLAKIVTEHKGILVRRIAWELLGLEQGRAGR